MPVIVQHKRLIVKESNSLVHLLCAGAKFAKIRTPYSLSAAGAGLVVVPQGRGDTTLARASSKGCHRKEWPGDSHREWHSGMKLAAIPATGRREAFEQNSRIAD
jgi:hypothetical protein